MLLDVFGSSDDLADTIMTPQQRPKFRDASPSLTQFERFEHYDDLWEGEDSRADELCEWIEKKGDARLHCHRRRARGFNEVGRLHFNRRARSYENEREAGEARRSPKGAAHAARQGGGAAHGCWEAARGR